MGYSEKSVNKQTNILVRFNILHLELYIFFCRFSCPPPGGIESIIDTIISNNKHLPTLAAVTDNIGTTYLTDNISLYP